MSAIDALGGDDESQMLIWDDPNVTVMGLRASLRKESVKHKSVW
jgi:hypothetical protein